jgi:hypothetical protein
MVSLGKMGGFGEKSSHGWRAPVREEWVGRDPRAHPSCAPSTSRDSENELDRNYLEPHHSLNANATSGRPAATVQRIGRLSSGKSRARFRAAAGNRERQDRCHNEGTTRARQSEPASSPSCSGAGRLRCPLKSRARAASHLPSRAIPRRHGRQPNLSRMGSTVKPQNSSCILRRPSRSPSRHAPACRSGTGMVHQRRIVQSRHTRRRPVAERAHGERGLLWIAGTLDRTLRS